jgi:chromosome partitioning protein
MDNLKIRLELLIAVVIVSICMTVFSVASMKGGVGKTTITAHLGWGLSKKFCVLLIDIDPQGLLSEIVLNKKECCAMYIFEPPTKLYTKNVKKNLDIVTANEKLERVMYDKIEMESLDRLDFGKWDIVIIDCPPGHNIFTTNALFASDFVLIPVKPHRSSLSSVDMDVGFIERMKKVKPNLKIGGIVINYIERSNHARDVVKTLKRQYPDLVFGSQIPETVKIRNATNNHQAVWEYAPVSKGAIAFKGLIKELTNKLRK